ncbi:MAG: (Fe-S)-binding protein, partial [bacterium]|nr:(Fe-S)-binding protein [bacterium]
KSGADVILSECGSCSSYLSEYNDLFNDENLWADRAARFSKKVYDINQFLDQFKTQREFKSTQQIRVSYHDPCHLSHFMKITSEPRQLIKQIDSVVFEELPEANWCCGGAGTYNIAHHDISMKILRRKIDNLDRTEASLLLSSCPGCLVQLAYGVRKFNKQVVVKHVVQLLNDTISI